MGVKNIFKLLNKILTNNNFSELKGKKVGIDLMNWIYHFLPSDQEISTMSTFQIQDRIFAGILTRVYKLFDLEITPILILDGNTIPLKMSTKEER